MRVVRELFSAEDERREWPSEQLPAGRQRYATLPE